MKKNVRTLIILGAVLVVCIGAYIGVTVYNNAQAQKAAEAATATQLWSNGRGAPVSITYTAGEQTLSFTQENDTWLVPDNRAFPLNQSTLTSLASALTSLTHVRTLDAAAPLSTYGLDPPAYTVTASDAAGNGMTLLIGDQNGGNYYAMEKGGDKIYTIASTLVSSLKTDLMSMIMLDTIHALTEKNIDTITLADGTKTLKLNKHQNKDGTTTWFIVSGDTVISEDEFVLTVDTEKSPGKIISDAVSALSTIKFSSCAAFMPTDDDLKAFGLNGSKRTVTVEYTDITGQGTLDQKSTSGSVILEIGAALPDGGGYYARQPGSDQVGVLALEDVTPLMEALDAIGS